MLISALKSDQKPLSFDDAREQLFLFVHHWCRDQWSGCVNWTCTCWRDFQLLLCLVHRGVKEKRDENWSLEKRNSRIAKKDIFNSSISSCSRRFSARCLSILAWSTRDRKLVSSSSRPRIEFSTRSCDKEQIVCRSTRLTRCPRIFEFFLLSVVLKFEFIVERPRIVDFRRCFYIRRCIEWETMKQ